MADATTQPQEEGYSSWWESAGNKLLLVREGAVNVVAGIPAIPGYMLDLANMADRAMGFNHYEGSAGDWIQTRAKAGLDAVDPLKWAGIKPEVKTTADAVILGGTEIVGDVAATVMSGGAGATKLVGTAGKYSSMFAATAEGGKATSMIRSIAKYFGKHADDVAPVAPQAATSILGAPVTRGGLLAAHATFIGVPLALAATEVATHGAVSQATIDATITGAKAAINAGVFGKEDIEPTINALGFGLELMNPLDISAHNALVSGARNASGEPDSEESINRAKAAAVGYMLMPTQATMLLAKHGLRSQLADELMPDQNEADRYLAESLVNDIVEKSHANALDDHQVTHDDVKKHLQAEFAKPDSAIASMLRGGRLENGLRQMWPDLDTNPGAPAASGSALNNSFQSAAQNAANATNDLQQAAGQQMQNQFMNMLMNVPVLGAIVAAFMKINEWIQDLGSMFSANTSAQTENPQRLGALLERMGGGAMPEITTHDGARRAPAITPQPQVAPAM